MCLSMAGRKRLRATETETLYRDQAGMILRKCGYVGGYYRGQYLGQYFGTCPVIEIVLYWGQERWNSAGSLREFYEDRKVRAQAWRFIDNAKLHVFEMRHLEPEVRALFSGDMRVVVEYINDRHNPEFLSLKVKHADCVLELIQILSGDERYGELLENLREQGRLEKAENEEEWTMCDLMDEAIDRKVQQNVNRGRQEGRLEGREEGIRALIHACKDLGESFENTAKRVMDSFKLPESVVNQDMAMYW